MQYQELLLSAIVANVYISSEQNIAILCNSTTAELPLTEVLLPLVFPHV
jgi:hypothetical protein